jgi:hypothetical protein
VRGDLAGDVEVRDTKRQPVLVDAEVLSRDHEEQGQLDAQVIVTPLGSANAVCAYTLPRTRFTWRNSSLPSRGRPLERALGSSCAPSEKSRLVVDAANGDVERADERGLIGEELRGGAESLGHPQ